jgi:chitodextrinase
MKSKQWSKRPLVALGPKRIHHVSTRRAALLRGVSVALALAMLISLSSIRPHVSTAAAGWQWYKTDTHVHSSVSADAFSDIGIHSQAAQSQGYDAIFLTDHNGASSFQINNLTANHMAFEDRYTRWEVGTYGTLSSTTNALASSPLNTGTNSLRLASTSSTSGETYVWTKRGPNLRSGDIILRVSIYPTRIDPGSGAYVSVSIGGDPTVEKSPSGYTTQGGVVSPGKTTTLVWQIGTPRVASSDPNARVLTYPLGAYTFNTWNTYTINVSAALADIPQADRPLDYNGLTYLKMATAANNGTAAAYFDTYSIDASAPVEPANEYVYRTSVVDDFNTSSFKVFPSYEMGQQRHTNRFNFGISSPSEYVSYTYGSDGIDLTHQTGYPAQLNHPGTTVTIPDAISNQGYEADFLEVREQEWIDAWDAILQQGVQMIGSWSSDSHSGLTSSKAATYIYAPALDFNELIRSYFEGRVYNGISSFSGRVSFNITSGSQDPFPARYPIYVSDAQSAANVHMAVTSGLSSGYTMRWVRNGTLLATDNRTQSSYDATKSIALGGASTYVRGEVRSSSGSLRAMTQPIFFIDVPGLPVDKSFYIDQITTADGRGYNKLSTKGITASNWNAASQALLLTLQDPANSLVRLRVSTNSGPNQVRVDGAQILVAASLAAFDSATVSTWYYDSTAKILYVKVLHTASTAGVQMEFATVSDTEPPTVPSNLTATAINSGQANLSWTASTDNVGVAGYDIYRNGALLQSIGTATSYSDLTVVAATTYNYQVRARDGSGNLSVPSNVATATVPIARLFSDGFESGNTSAWTFATGMSVQQQEVYAGAYAARTTSTGSATWAYEQLPTSQSQLYYRARFKIISQGANNVYLLKFRTGTGTSLLGIYVSNTGKLGYRNDITALSSSSTTSVALGTWHDLQMRVLINGTSSQTETWLNGTRIDALSKTESLGTTPLGRVQLGDNSTGRTYDVAFDGVEVDTSFITP